MRHIKTLLVGLAILIAFGVASGWVVYLHYSADLPDFQQLADYHPATVTRVQAADGKLIAEYATEKRVFVPIKAMPPLMIEAVIAAEDRDFYSHPGVDPIAIVRAELTNLFHLGSGHRQIGASTITQQVARIFLLSNDYSYSRKIKEAILAIRLDQALTKDRILELYLNAPYFGEGAYGVADAALVYFNKSLEELTIQEAAFLAGVLKGPSYYDPVRHYDRAKERRDYVIDGMARTGAITEAEAKVAIASPIVLRKRDDTEFYSAPYFAEEVRRQLVDRFGETAVYSGGLSVRTSLNPILQTYADKALRDGLLAYDRRHGWRGPVGHLDMADGKAWQKQLAAVPVPPGAAPWKLAVVRELKPDSATLGLSDGTDGVLPMSEMTWARPTLEDQHVGETPKTPANVVKRGDLVLVEQVHPADKDKPAAYGLRQIPAVSGALLAIDPHTGRVLAMTGGWSFEMSQFNRVTQAKRQVGSAIKPFVYLAALENGMTPSTLISDLPVSVDQGPGLPKWQPKNFESDEFHGAEPLRYAIEHSINTMTVRMAATIGIEKIPPYIERLGIMDKMPLEYSMVLGAGETTPLRLTTAYAMLVNGGKKITPSLIDRVQDRNGVTIFKQDNRACPRCGDPNWPGPDEVPSLPDDREQVLDPGTAYQMVNILQGVVQRGTGAEIGMKLPNIPLAGKTGTTNGPNDAWFIGFSPDLVAGVYIGFDQPKPLGPREQGATVTVPVFEEFMADALKNKPPIDFRIPPGIRLVRVDAATGRLPEPGDRNVIWEAFKPGSEPGTADMAEQVVEGGQGLETLSPAESGVVIPAGGTPVQRLPSTKTPGLY